jgi:hypothetical protein
MWRLTGKKSPDSYEKTVYIDTMRPSEFESIRILFGREAKYSCANLGNIAFNGGGQECDQSVLEETVKEKMSEFSGIKDIFRKKDGELGCNINDYDEFSGIKNIFKRCNESNSVAATRSTSIARWAPEPTSFIYVRAHRRRRRASK